jgi:hypothetical protein
MKINYKTVNTNQGCTGERQETSFEFRKADFRDRKSQSDSIHEVVSAPGETRWNEMILVLGNPNPVRVELLGQKNRKCQIKAGRDKEGNDI